MHVDLFENSKKRQKYDVSKKAWAEDYHHYFDEDEDDGPREKV